MTHNLTNQDVARLRHSESIHRATKQYAVVRAEPTSKLEPVRPKARRFALLRRAAFGL